MTTTLSRRKRTGWRFVGYIARRALLMELRGYQSIYRFAFRRPKVPAGAVGFSYYQPVLAILIVFAALSAVEIVVLDLIVRRWAHIRIPLLILSVWGLIYMLGFLFGMLTRPHAIGPNGIRARYGTEIDVLFPGTTSTLWLHANTPFRTSNRMSLSTKMARRRCICECRMRPTLRSSSKRPPKYDSPQGPKRSVRSPCTPTIPRPS
jgi:hypothetical protein